MDGCEGGEGTVYLYSGSYESFGKYYILLDEIQEVTDWEKAVNAFLVDLDADIYVTGSNSRLLSSEFSTYLAGRYVAFHIMTLSLGNICYSIMFLWQFLHPTVKRNF